MQDAIDFLLHRFGDRASINSDVRQLHGQDESFHKSAQPDLVVFPKSTNEVREIVLICAKHKVPIVPFGAGTSLEGHIAAIMGGVCIDLSQMNKVLEIYPSDMDVHIEAGITPKYKPKRATIEPYPCASPAVLAHEESFPLSILTIFIIQTAPTINIVFWIA